MLNIVKNTLAVLILTLIIVPVTCAQKPSTSGEKSDDEFVTEKGFKSKVFEIKYRDPNRLGGVLGQLGSGFKGAAISASSEFKTITVRDFPENLIAIEEAIKRLDTPITPQPDIELHMHVLIASNTVSTAGKFPAELKDVIVQLRSTLNYTNYELATTIIQRLKENRRSVQGRGTTESTPSTNGNTNLPYEFSLNSVTLASTPSGAAVVQIEEFKFSTLTDRDRAQMQTALNLRDGEKAVVGTATLKDRALIIVLTARVIK